MGLNDRKWSPKAARAQQYVVYSLCLCDDAAILLQANPCIHDDG